MYSALKKKSPQTKNNTKLLYTTFLLYTTLC